MCVRTPGYSCTAASCVGRASFPARDFGLTHLPQPAWGPALPRIGMLSPVNFGIGSAMLVPARWCAPRSTATSMRIHVADRSLF